MSDRYVLAENGELTFKLPDMRVDDGKAWNKCDEQAA